MHDANKERKEFREAMAVLFIAYRKPLDSEATNVYFKFLKGKPIDKLKAAIAGIISTSKHFPTIAEILEFMLEDEASEVEVRADILNAISEYGIYKKPKFKYEISHAMVDDLGWQTLCTYQRKDLDALIHFRYEPILSSWRNCKNKGLPFKLSGVKGIFEGRGNDQFKQIGDLIAENDQSDKNR